MSTTPPYSLSRRAGDLLFISGQVPSLPEGGWAEGITDQTRLVLEKIKAILADNGLGLDAVVKCQVFLTTMEDWPAMNAVYAEVFGQPYPARSAFGVELIAGALVEIEAIASFV